MIHKSTDNRRNLRVAEVIRQEVIAFFRRRHFCDDSFCVLKVDLSKDLRTANVHISKVQDTLLQDINNSLHTLRSHIAKVLTLRAIPKIKITIADNEQHYSDIFNFAEHAGDNL